MVAGVVVVEDLVAVVEVVVLPRKVQRPPPHSRTAARLWGHLEQGCCWHCITAALPLLNLLAAWAGGW